MRCVVMPVLQLAATPVHLRLFQVALLLAASCASIRLPDPPQTDEALAEGRVLTLPVEDPFPRLGIQWTYQVSHVGFGKDADFPPRIAYRLTARRDMGHPWAGWWMYGSDRGMAYTGATIEPHDVFFHPPRAFGFSVLQWAPWPIATPGEPGRKDAELTFGEGWGKREGERVRKTHVDIGPRSVDVPAGRFAGAWYVEASSPGWSGRFWWADRVGFLRMVFANDDGRRIRLDLLAVRQIGDPEE
ncbi:MAG: hypothetical protein ACYTDU_02570 [Planctomycetota bacterium]